MTRMTILGIMLSVGMALLAASPALADISDVAFRITAEDPSGAGTFEVYREDLSYNEDLDLYFWLLPKAVNIEDGGGRLLGTLTNANLAIRTDPQVGLGFAVQAGSTQTTFTISSALLSFPTISASVAEGRASAGFTATDLDGDGVALIGLGPPGTGAYRADYNGFVGGGTMFASLVAEVVASGGSASASQNHPMSGWADITDDVNDMSAHAAFTLSANDLASGTSTFEIIPEPMTGMLLLFPAVVLMGRRRR